MSEPLAPSLPFEAGELIAGKYRLDRLLGAGGMGVVVAATHLDLDRPVAIKLIREELSQDPAIVERLMLEARAAAKITSNHVGQVLDVGKLPSGAPYIVMEFLEGVDLCQLLERDGALPIAGAVDIVLQACEALAEAHQAHIVHRDLKPENLFVARFPDGSHNIKVLDFGISKQLGDPKRRALTNPSSAVGSPQYMAPEQMQGGEIDIRVDIWALGAILYELLSGRQAFEGSTLPAICIQVMGHAPVPLAEHVPHLPDRLVEIVNRCLDKNREGRFSSVAEFAEHLAPFGSAQAARSLERIRGVVAGDRQATPVPGQDRVESAPTLAATAGEGLELEVAKTEQWTPELQNDSPRAAARWPIFLGLLGVIVIGAGLWVLSKTPPPAANEMPRASTENTAVIGRGPTAPASPEMRAVAAPGTTGDPGRVPASAGPELPRGPTTAPTVTPQLEPSVTPVVRDPVPEAARPTTRRRSPPSRSVPKSGSTPRTDAWDPDSFGGRR